MPPKEPSPAADAPEAPWAYRPPPTARQLEALKSILSLTEAGGEPPTVRELAFRLGAITARSAAQLVAGLERRGLVTRIVRAHRSVRLTPAGLIWAARKP